MAADAAGTEQVRGAERTGPAVGTAQRPDVGGVERVVRVVRVVQVVQQQIHYHLRMHPSDTPLPDDPPLHISNTRRFAVAVRNRAGGTAVVAVRMR